MKAMILAAGLGTRLKPFTDHHPKALFEVDGVPLLEHSLLHLRRAGIREVIINVHHFAGQITAFIARHDHFGMEIAVSDETGALLETGGGLKKAAWFLQDCDAAIIRNVDILSDLDLARMAGAHLDSGALATLAVRRRETSRYLLFNPGMQLCGWENTKSGERIAVREAQTFIPLAFSGIQVISPAIFPLITEEGKFSLTSLYLRLAAQHPIAGYADDGTTWADIGKA